MVENEPNYTNEIYEIVRGYTNLSERVNKSEIQVKNDTIKIAGIFLKHEESKLPAGDFEFALDIESNIASWDNAISLANSGKWGAVSGLILHEVLHLLEIPEQDRTKTDSEIAHGLVGMIGQIYKDSTM